MEYSIRLFVVIAILWPTTYGCYKHYNQIEYDIPEEDYKGKLPDEDLYNPCPPKVRKVYGAKDKCGYVKCLNGQPVYRQCPDGTVYLEKNQDCSNTISNTEQGCSAALRKSEKLPFCVRVENVMADMFEKLLAECKNFPQKLKVADLVKEFKKVLASETKKTKPEDLYDQLIVLVDKFKHEGNVNVPLIAKSTFTMIHKGNTNVAVWDDKPVPLYEILAVSIPTLESGLKRRFTSTEDVKVIKAIFDKVNLLLMQESAATTHVSNDDLKKAIIHIIEENSKFSLSEVGAITMQVFMETANKERFKVG